MARRSFQLIILPFQLGCIIGLSGGTPAEFVLGIHFGRKYIRMAALESGYLKVIPNSVGDHKTPIIVGFNTAGNVLVGREAKQSAGLGDVIITNLQDIIGKTYEEIQSLKEHPFSYHIENRYNKPLIKVSRNNHTVYLTIEEVLSHLFLYMKASGETFLEKMITSAILSVPDHFTKSKLQSIRSAAGLAGIQITKSVTDSLAAVYAYELDESEEETILVLDISEDTMNLAVVVCEGRHQEIVGWRHVPTFGGSRFHAPLETHLRRLYRELTGTELTSSSVLQELKREVKFAIRDLSRFSVVNFHWTSVGVNLDVTVSIGRAKFDELIVPVLSEMTRQITDLLLDLEFKRSDISQVVLLGSTFAIRKSQKEIRNYFYGRKLRVEKSFEEVPLLGVTRIGFSKRDETDTLRVVLPDIAPFSMGIEVHGGMMDVIIEKGSALPIRKSKVYTISSNNQSKVFIVCIEGDKAVARKNSFLGKIEFGRPSSGRRSEIHFEIEFEIRRNGETMVTATDLQTRVRKFLRIKKNYEQTTESWMPSEREEEVDVRDVQAKLAHDILQEIESVAYELKAHIENRSTYVQMVKSPIDVLLLKQSVDEVLQWSETHSIQDLDELRQLKEKFESIVKPILERTFN